MSKSSIKDLAVEKAQELTKRISSDERWKLEDELMCQVFGFTLFGYIFGIGRLKCFMDTGEIKVLVAQQLTELGIGKKYSKGMVDVAEEHFFNEDKETIYYQLIDVGHSHALTEDMDILVDSVFVNADSIRQRN